MVIQEIAWLSVERYFRLISYPSRCAMHSPRRIPVSYPYLARSAGVRGGSTIVEGTRIGVHDVIGLLQNGETMETLIARCFPELTRSQVYECLAYYEDHRGEIDLLVARQFPAEG